MIKAFFFVKKVTRYKLLNFGCFYTLNYNKSFFSTHLNDRYCTIQNKLLYWKYCFDELFSQVFMLSIYFWFWSMHFSYFIIDSYDTIRKEKKSRLIIQYKMHITVNCHFLKIDVFTRLYRALQVIIHWMLF